MSLSIYIDVEDVFGSVEDAARDIIDDMNTLDVIDSITYDLTQSIMNSSMLFDDVEQAVRGYVEDVVWQVEDEFVDG